MVRGRDDELTRVRRRDRVVEDEGWIRDFLHRAAMGILATVEGDQPFINTNLFVYDEEGDAIYMHTARRGRTRDNLESDGRVCFAVASMGRILPADTALEFSVEYDGVVVFGSGRVIDDDEEKAKALQLLLDKYAPHLKPGRDYRPAIKSELDRTAVFRIAIDSWSGKRKQAEDDFPGAFEYTTWEERRKK